MANLLRIRTLLTGSALVGPGVTTMYYHDTGLLTDAQNAANDVKAAWTALTTGFGSTLRWDLDPQVTVINDATGDVVGFYNVTGGGGSPTGSSVTVPAQAQIEVALKTQTVVNGRILQGRVFLPNAVQTGSNNINPAAASITQATAFANALEGTPTPGMKVWSRAHGTSAEVVSVVVRPTWRTLRSRLN